MRATLLALVLLSACAGSRFAKISPGMTAADVSKTMEEGPSQAQAFEGSYSAWYYGKDRCVLLRDDKVVEKHQTEDRTAVYTPLGNVSEHRLARCAPPGAPGAAGTATEVHTPFGGVQVDKKE